MGRWIVQTQVSQSLLDLPLLPQRQKDRLGYSPYTHLANRGISQENLNVPLYESLAKIFVLEDC